MSGSSFTRAVVVLCAALLLRVITSSFVNETRSWWPSTSGGTAEIAGHWLGSYSSIYDDGGISLKALTGGTGEGLSDDGGRRFFLTDIPTLFSFSTSSTGKVHWIEALTLLFLPGSTFNATQTGNSGAQQVSFLRRDMGQASGNGFVHPLLLDLLRVITSLGGCTTSEKETAANDSIAGDSTAALWVNECIVPSAEAFLVFVLPFFISLCFLYYSYRCGCILRSASHPESIAVVIGDHEGEGEGSSSKEATVTDDVTHRSSSSSSSVLEQIKKVNCIAANSLNLPTTLALLWFFNPLFVLQAASLDLAVVEQAITCFAFVCLFLGTKRSMPNMDHFALLLPSINLKGNVEHKKPSSAKLTAQEDALEKIKKLPVDKQEDGSGIALILAVLAMFVLIVLHPPRVALLVGVTLVADTTSKWVIAVTCLLAFATSLSTSIKLIGSVGDTAPLWHYLSSFGSHYKASLLLESGYPMGEPNLSVQWYFFQTMFVEYNRLYCYAFRLFPLVLTVGVALKIQYLVFPTQREVIREVKRVAQKTNLDVEKEEGGGHNHVEVQPRQYPDIDVAAPIAIFLIANLLVVLCKPMVTLPEMCFAMLLCIVGAFPLLHGAGIQTRRLKRMQMLLVVDVARAQPNSDDEVTGDAIMKQGAEEEALRKTAVEERGDGLRYIAPLLAFFCGMIPVTHVFYYAWLVQQVANPNFLFFSCTVMQAGLWLFLTELTRAVMKQGRG